MNGIGYGITPFMGSHGILARSSGGGVTPFVNEYSMSFDGVDEYFTMGNVLNMADDGSDAFSISFWIKSPNGANIQRFVSKLTPGLDGYGIYQNGNIIYMLIGNYINNCLFNQYNWSSLNNNTWHHIVWTYDGSQNASGMKLHLNGGTNVLIGGTTNLPINSVNTTADLRIGDSGQLGLMDEISFFNYQLNQTEITSIYNGGVPTDLTSLSPLGWWRMGEGDTFSNPGGIGNWTLTDKGSGGNDATSVNMEEGDRVTDVP